VREVGPLRPDLVRDDVRLTLDTAEDLDVIRRVSAALGPGPFGLAETLAWLDAHPEVAGINRHVRQKLAREAA
jgi:spore coat polysaccharide biosynthesis protein SpsF (cytidylyltransferase family)